ncbi:ligand-binding sensor domain-containing protein [Echinicola shivajiensis]|uniref:hypothetical protein n=1 Tax=Echinicola shivajiensis TaxID=1035916 RepID=UPI001BFCCF21|nr:hypothetical protein [Echinicola shivajiensis]
MQKNIFILTLLAISLSEWSCTSEGSTESTVSTNVYIDEVFMQDYSIKYFLKADVEPLKVGSDRNGVIKVLTKEGLYQPHAGDFLYPGTLVPDHSYRGITDKSLKDMQVEEEQFMFLDTKAVLSNAWAGALYVEHGMNKVQGFVAESRYAYLISNGKSLSYIKDSKKVWSNHLGEDINDITYSDDQGKYFIASSKGLYSFDVKSEKLRQLLEGQGFTSLVVLTGGEKAMIGTTNGYFEFDLRSNKASNIKKDLPWTDITCVKEIKGNIWFGTTKGAFRLKSDGTYDYYFGERWLLGDEVIDIAKGNHEEVLVLTEKGLSKLVFEPLTLYDKAMYYEQQVRKRHIRYGFNSSLSSMEKGNIDSGMLKDSDNDGLWTAMYLGGQGFRYAVTGDLEALQNCKESLDAMERLYTINPVKGFPSRSFNRSGYIDVLSDPERWQHTDHPEWDWKATTSSDEAIGHVFAFGVLAELVDDPDIKKQAISLLDALMQHIVDNDFYLIDYDGKPTLWGKWHPDYVNNFPNIVGDRKLNSSNIIAMLQTAYHFTNKEIYKEKAFELMEKHGYLENLMVPMENIGKVPEDADKWAAMLSEAWNHSDDEMYFLGYWGLYRYAFNDSLKTKYKLAIKDHWGAERPEKEGLWNIFTAMVSPEDFDREEAIWYLKEYPLDLINWTMVNSHRKDIKMLENNFRQQSTASVLPPDELMIRRHNANRFNLDGGSDGRQESSAGDIWLLPYWMGRYLGVISSPEIANYD